MNEISVLAVRRDKYLRAFFISLLDLFGQVGREGLHLGGCIGKRILLNTRSVLEDGGEPRGGIHVSDNRLRLEPSHIGKIHAGSTVRNEQKVLVVMIFDASCVRCAADPIQVAKPTCRKRQKPSVGSWVISHKLLGGFAPVGLAFGFDVILVAYLSLVELIA